MPVTFTLSSFLYEGLEYLRINFPYSYSAKEHLKSFPGTHWGTELGFWYMQDPDALIELKAHLESHGYHVRVLSGKQDARTVIKKVKSIGEHPLLDRFRNYLIKGRYSQSTISGYVSLVRQFIVFLDDIKPEEAANADAEAFLEYLLLKRRISNNTYHQTVRAIGQFAVFLQSSSLRPEGLSYPQYRGRLPILLGRAEVIRLLQLTRNLKQRAITTLLYRYGLRIKELINLPLNDIDLYRKQLFIKEGKGCRERCLILSGSILPLLENYLHTYSPKTYFAEGETGQPCSPTTIRRFLKRNARRAGILKEVTPQTLRHSFANHLLEQGIDLRHILQFLGHSQPGTTMVRNHEHRQVLLKTPSPLHRLHDP